MTTNDFSIARELKEKLSQIVEIVDFRIFGSRARGDNDEYSDLDVYIVVRDINEELEKKISEISWQVGYDNYIIISPLVYTLDDIQNTPQRSSPIVKVIQEEGIPI